MEFGTVEAVYCAGFWLTSFLAFLLLLASLKVSKRK
jgi:hypothetical protein